MQKIHCIVVRPCVLCGDTDDVEIYPLLSRLENGTIVIGYDCPLSICTTCRTIHGKPTTVIIHPGGAETVYIPQLSTLFEAPLPHISSLENMTMMN